MAADGEPIAREDLSPALLGVGFIVGPNVAVLIFLGGAIAWLVANGHRRCRHRGVDANRLALSIRAATINLRRLLNLGLDWNGVLQIAP